MDLHKFFDDNQVIDWETDAIFGSYMLKLLAHADFAYATAQNRLTALEIITNGDTQTTFNTPDDQPDTNNPGGLGRRGRIMRLASWIDFDSRLTVGYSTARTTNAYIKSRLAVLAPCSAIFRNKEHRIFCLMTKMHYWLFGSNA